MSDITTSITCALVPEQDRSDFVANIFGIHFPLRLEPFVFFMADTMCDDYSGGYWNFFALSNGGIFMSPHSDKHFTVSCENGFQGDLTADAFGITCSLYAYSHLSFGEGEFAQLCAEHFHLLRDYAIDHPDAGNILRAID